MYHAHMKLTLNIDDALLNRVMTVTGIETKTEAIHYALNEIDRRNRLIELLANDDLGLTSEEWKNAFDENSVVDDESAALRVAEKSARA